MRSTLRRCLFVAVAVGMAVPVWMLAAEQDGKTPKDDKQAFQEMLVHARQAYKATVNAYEAGVIGSPEELYLWSLRQMKAEQRILGAERKSQAAQEHYARMSQHLASVRDLSKHGARGGEDYKLAAFEFYVAEARELLNAPDAG